ncbi:MAG TPA: glycosyltransferase family 4 protein, partial [Gemmatimonadales bacterium]|nr:glycosyltransferase family 4 protein [Gemmatimonadales bacterium]
MPEPMPRRVLHVMNAASGGAALSTLELVRGLDARGISSAIVCNPAGAADDRARLAEAVSGRVLFTPLYLWNRKLRAAAWKRPLLALWLGGRTGFARASALRVARFAAAQRAELIHTSTFTTPEGGLAARWLGLPHVWHLRELLGPGNPFRLTREGPALAAWLETHCSRVVANSATSARTLAGWVPTGFIDVVPNGVDVGRFTPASTRARAPGAP